MSALDIAPVIQGVMLTDLEAADEVRCQSLHRSDGGCSVEVRWSRPAMPCGCQPRLVVCQADYDWIYADDYDLGTCTDCGREFSAATLRKGWYPV